MDAVAFGTARRGRPADRAGARHARAGARRADRGRRARSRPARPTAADDPELLLWILAALAESAMLVFRTYVRSLTRDELNALWLDYRVVGRCFGLRASEMPARHRRLRRYMADMYAERRPAT